MNVVTVAMQGCSTKFIGRPGVEKWRHRFTTAIIRFIIYINNVTTDRQGALVTWKPRVRYSSPIYISPNAQGGGTVRGGTTSINM